MNSWKPGPINVKPLKGKSQARALKRKKNGNEDCSGIADEQYIVENIEDKRVKDDKVQYFVKWLGYPKSQNTWEPVENLKMVQWMIDSYEKRSSPLVNGAGRDDESPPRNFNSKYKVISLEAYRRKLKQMSSDEPINILEKCPPERTVEKVLAVAALDGILTYLVQWKSEDENDNNEIDFTRGPISSPNVTMIRSMAVNAKFPQEVIKFYEQKIRFNTNLDSPETQREKAQEAIAQARKRKENEDIVIIGEMKRTRTEIADSDSSEDEVEAIVQRERRQMDKFDPEILDSESDVFSDDDAADVFAVDDDDLCITDVLTSFASPKHE